MHISFCEDNDNSFDINSNNESDPDREDFLSCEELRDWAVCNKISLNALSSLLKMLQKHHPNLPKDGRTLLHTNNLKYKPR